MMDAAYLPLPPFRLNLRAEQLELGDAPIDLRPKAYALLYRLASHPGELLTKDRLLEAVWPGRIISEGGLSELVRELRSVLGDDARHPRFIETVHGRGYRFIGATDTARPASPRVTAPRPVGRADELATLHGCYGRAITGARQIMFVTGEPGIGKTTVVEAFRRELGALVGVQTPRVAAGQCIEQYGTREAYLPILDAISRMVRGEQDHTLLDVLRRLAPTWLVQLPSLLDGAELERLERRAVGVTRDRMLREMAEALEALTAHRPLLLIMEDVHWSDYSTLDLLTFIAQRREPARLMVMATFRPVEVYMRDHPLKLIKQDMEGRGQCQDLLLGCLSPAAVEEYLERHFSSTDGAPSMSALAPVVYRRTEGHPLFMVNVADYVASVGFGGFPDSVLNSIPNGVRQMIEKQVERLSDQEQRLLEAASAVGFEFSAASLAAALCIDDVDAVDEACVGLVRRAQFLVSRASRRWPDGSVAGVYRFTHALYQNVLYHRVAPGVARLHLRIGLREEQGWGARAAEIAAELAAHFEAGQDHVRAIDYLAIAGERATRRCAGHEAIALFKHALDLLAHIDDPTLRDQYELRLCIALGAPLIQARGYGADEVATVYTRARELHERVGEPAQLYVVLWSLWLMKVALADHAAALTYGRQLQTLEAQDRVGFPLAHYTTGCSQFWLGDFHGARTTLDRALDTYDRLTHGQMVGLYSQDARTVSLPYRGMALWILGYAEQGLEACEASVEWADALGHHSAWHSHTVSAPSCTTCGASRWRRVTAASRQAPSPVSMAFCSGSPGAR
ncbi:MAG: AAA family ATPase [Proteobacteria bacterium]|nr:AAA family ATPase [Pseudomonadota bacterium]